MEGNQKHLSQSHCRCSSDQTVFQVLTKHTECNTLAHTAPAHGSNQVLQRVLMPKVTICLPQCDGQLTEASNERTAPSDKTELNST